ncbi:Uncharacterised protein [Vibrio cholerae]|nr:Uncharacterised protein [Vibrio cholerae]
MAAQFVEHLARIGHLFLPIEQFTQPSDLLIVATACCTAALFVFPVCRYPKL